MSQNVSTLSNHFSVPKAFLPLVPTFATTLPQLCQFFTTYQLYANLYQ